MDVDALRSEVEALKRRVAALEPKEKDDDGVEIIIYENIQSIAFTHPHCDVTFPKDSPVCLGDMIPAKYVGGATRMVECFACVRDDKKVPLIVGKTGTEYEFRVVTSTSADFYKLDPTITIGGNIRRKYGDV